MSTERVQGAAEAMRHALDELTEALAFLDGLKKGAAGRERDIARDAIIKRFEVAFEYAWKLMKAAAEYQGTEAAGPRPAIQEAVRYGWIDDPEFWADALEARNGSVHDYFGMTKVRYLAIIREFARKADGLVVKVKASA